MLTTPDPPVLAIEISPGLGLNSVLISNMPPACSYGGASIASPGVAMPVLPTTITGLFEGENTCTVLIIGGPGWLGPIITCGRAGSGMTRSKAVRIPAAINQVFGHFAATPDSSQRQFRMARLLRRVPCLPPILTCPLRAPAPGGVPH